MGNNEDNQVQPVSLSSKGRYILSEELFKFSIENKEINITGLGTIGTGNAGTTLREVKQCIRKKYFLSTGTMPDSLLITNPQ